MKRQALGWHGQTGLGHSLLTQKFTFSPFGINDSDQPVAAAPLPHTDCPTGSSLGLRAARGAPGKHRNSPGFSPPASDTDTVRMGFKLVF